MIYLLQCYNFTNNKCFENKFKTLCKIVLCTKITVK